MSGKPFAVMRMAGGKVAMEWNLDVDKVRKIAYVSVRRDKTSFSMMSIYFASTVIRSRSLILGINTS